MLLVVEAFAMKFNLFRIPQTPSDNLALSGVATQDSTYRGKVASQANDGNRNPDKKFCSHTDSTENTWWRLDLRDTYFITSIVITNRQDELTYRIEGAQIRIGDSLQNNGNDNPIVAIITRMRAGETKMFSFTDDPKGRYVNVFQPGGWDKFLILCEVEVYGYQDEKDNVALRGEATQIDTYNEFGAASNAIDGNRDPIYSHNSCTHTATTTNPWWRLDLNHTHVITSITVKNRGDCCAQRLDGAQIRVGDSLLNNGNDNPVVAKISHIPLGLSETFQLSEKVEGRYINVYLPGIEKYLTLCEVEVTGYEAVKGESPDSSM